MAERIYKEQVIRMMAERMGCSKAQASDALSAALDSLQDALRDNDRITLTGEMMDVPPSHRVAFVAGKGLADKVRGARE